jgi:hypothetical protein
MAKSATPPKTPSAPAGLSSRSAKLWAEILEHSEPEYPHEFGFLERALAAHDLADTLRTQAKAAGYGTPTGARLLGAARDADAVALKYFAALKIRADDEKEPRPGRPSDTRWSAMRRRRMTSLRAPVV